VAVNLEGEPLHVSLDDLHVGADWEPVLLTPGLTADRRRWRLDDGAGVLLERRS
jgi:hypothetical protein